MGRFLKLSAPIKSRENGHNTTKTLAESLGLSTKAIEKHLAKLKAEGIIARIGPDKGGHWSVTE